MMGTREKLKDYQYRGARAMVLLHEQHLWKFYDTWRKAKNSAVMLPQTTDSSYISYNALLKHVLFWARKYMIWMCEMLELPSPDIPPIPEVDDLDEKAENYIKNLLHEWCKPLSKVAEKRFYQPEYLAPWKTKYCIDAMLEHAVMHPIRHHFQLLELMDEV
jgi:hypothetical protein